MKYDFDKVIDRRNTDCLKFDFAEKRGKSKDILPLWIADMDFMSPPCVLKALEARCKHGVFGYTDTQDEYTRVLHDWFASRFAWEIDPCWLVKAPGVVYAVAMAVRAFSEKGEAVLIQPPVYYPFSAVIRDNGRKLVNNQLVYHDGCYSVDYAGFEKAITDNDVKIFILCNPHNPVGRVWTTDELTRMGDICLKHGVIVVSDEIHSDFIYPGNKHTVFASIKPEFADITVTCTAPTKTFNLAAIQCANTFISNASMRKKYIHEINSTGYSQPNVMGLTACMSAYRDGADWLEELLVYIQSNLDFTRQYFRDNLPSVRLVEPEGTYLAWLDFTALNIDDAGLDKIIVSSGVWLDTGSMFGEGGEGFQRINIGCPRVTLAEALNRITKAFR